MFELALQWFLLMLAALAAGALSGAVGFGGALFLLPILTAVRGAQEAVPLLTIVQWVGNSSRAAFGWRDIRWRWVGLFLLGAAPAGALGATAFVHLPPAWGGRLIGLAIWAVLLLGHLAGGSVIRRRWTFVAGGALTGLLSGAAGSAGPLGAAFFLGLSLPPGAYVASEAVAAMGLHAIKLAIYLPSLDLAPAAWVLAGLLSFGIAAGSWVGRLGIIHARTDRFRRWVKCLLAALAAYLIVQPFRW